MRIELDELYQRSHLINRAITLSSTCALLICLVIAALFLGDALDLHLDKIVAALFVSGVLALIGSFIYFLREIFVATKTLRRQREHGARFSLVGSLYTVLIRSKRERKTTAAYSSL